MHPLLKRQIKRVGSADLTIPPSPEKWDQLVERISNAYTEADQGRELLERSLALSSKEMQQLYDNLRQTSELRLKDMEKQTKNLIDHALDGIISMNAEGKILTWNPQASEIFGWAFEQVIGKYLVDLIIPLQYHEAHRQELIRFAQTKSGTITNKRLELTALHRDGHEFPVEISIIPIVQGDTYFFYGLVRDITQRQLAEQALRQAKETAEQATKAKSEFLATMSHEIRTPMNGVIGMTGLLLETDLAPQQRKFAQTVRSSGETLLKIINDILDFSKIESGKLEFEIIPFDLRTTLEDSLELLAETAGKKNLELVGLVGANVPTALRGDPGRLRQIFMNLTGNAIKFTSEGEVIVKITSVQETQDHVIIRVDIHDTGVGIPSDVLPKLFQPFSQADSSTTRRHGGTGLGLAICKQLVRQMSGEIGVENRLEGGSTFWFTARFQKQPVLATSLAQTPVDLGNLRVCAVDNHLTSRQLLEQYFQCWNMEGALVENPKACLALLQQQAQKGTPFGLAILDMEMPDMDGFELAKLIKSDENLKDTRLILLTSFGRRGDATAAQHCGFSGYLTKPIRKAQLQSCLETVMGLPQSDAHFAPQPLVTSHFLKDLQRQQAFRILVVDDHQVNQQLGVLMVERMGYRADLAGNGLEAIEAISRIPYDLILMDCQMPEMDGYEATKQIRKAESVKREEKGKSSREGLDVKDKAEVATMPDAFRLMSDHVPIIALTANAMQGDRDKCLQAGMDDYLSKPICPEELSNILAKWLPQPEIALSPTTATLEASTHAPTHDSPDSDFINHDTLAELEILGGREFLQSMIQSFVEDALQCVTLIEQALDTQDLAKVQEAAHGLKGISKNMGANTLAQVALDLETACKAGEATFLSSFRSTIQESFQTTRQKLEDNLKNT